MPLLVHERPGAHRRRLHHAGQRSRGRARRGATECRWFRSIQSFNVGSGPDDTVYGDEPCRPDGKILVGGIFQPISIKRGAWAWRGLLSILAGWIPVSWTWPTISSPASRTTYYNPAVNPPNPVYSCVEVQPDGNVRIGGAFRGYGRRRWRPDLPLAARLFITAIIPPCNVWHL